MDRLDAAFDSSPIVRVGPDHTEVQAHLASLELEDRAGGLAAVRFRLDAVVTDEDDAASRPYDDDRILSLGAEVYVGMADQDRAPHSMFSGKVTAVEAVFGEGPPAVLVHAEDALQRLRLKRRTKVHDDLVLPKLLKDLCQPLSLTADVEGFDASLGPQVQLNESDLAFVRRLVLEHDGELQLVETTLQVRKVASLDRGEVKLDVLRNKLRCRIRADLAHQVTEVTLSGWDVAQGTRIAATSAATALGPGSGRHGPGMFDGVFGARSEHLAHVPVANQDEADLLVRAMHDQRARAFVTLECVAPGDPRIRVGARIALTGAGRRFDNTYQVVETLHSKHRGERYETRFLAQCAFIGAST